MRAWPFAEADGLPPPVTPRNGIVTLYEKPPKSGGPAASGSLVIGPSYGGDSVELLTMITPAAPACWPKIAFATRAHVPRATTMIVFAGSELSAPSTFSPVDGFRQPLLMTPA